MFMDPKVTEERRKAMVEAYKSGNFDVDLLDQVDRDLQIDEFEGKSNGSSCDMAVDDGSQSGSQQEDAETKPDEEAQPTEVAESKVADDQVTISELSKIDKKTNLSVKSKSSMRSKNTFFSHRSRITRSDVFEARSIKAGASARQMR